MPVDCPLKIRNSCQLAGPINDRVCFACQASGPPDPSRNELLARMAAARVGKLDQSKQSFRLVTFNQPTKPATPPPTSSRAVIVVAPTARTQAELQFTRPGLIAYAKKCDADFVELREVAEQPIGCAQKWTAALVAGDYGRSLLIDTDIVISAGMPDLFKLYPDPDSWAAVDDLPAINANPSPHWFADHYAELLRAIDLPNYWPRATWNSGLVLMPRHAAEIYHAPPRPLPDHWCIEQSYFTHRLIESRAGIHDLTPEFNAGYFRADWPELIADAHAIHLAGCEPHSVRLGLLEHFAAGNRTLPAALLPPKHKTNDPTDKGYRPTWLHRRCEHLPKVPAMPAACNCWQQSNYNCPKLGRLVTPRTDCGPQCTKFEIEVR